MRDPKPYSVLSLSRHVFIHYFIIADKPRHGNYKQPFFPQIQVPEYVEQVRDNLAENIHEMRVMNKIEQGWTYAERRDDLRLHHPCLKPFELLPPSEK